MCLVMLCLKTLWQIDIGNDCQVASSESEFVCHTHGNRALEVLVVF